MLKLGRIKDLLSVIDQAWRRINKPLVTSRRSRLAIVIAAAIIIFILISVIFALALTSIVSEARVWDWKILGKEELVTYPKIDSETQHEMRFRFNTVPVVVTMFTTLSPPNEVIGFYKDSMVKRGWGVAYPIEGEKLKWLKENKPEIAKKLNHPIFNPQQLAFLVLYKDASATEGERLGLTYKISAVREPVMERTGVYIRREEGEIDFGDSTRDAPGEDLKVIPRYPEVIRRVCLEEMGGPTTLIYESQADPAAIIRFYKKELAQKEWGITSFPENKSGSPDNFIFFENKRGEGGMISVVYDKETASSQIIILYKISPSGILP